MVGRDGRKKCIFHVLPNLLMFTEQNECHKEYTAHTSGWHQCTSHTLCCRVTFKFIVTRHVAAPPGCLVTICQHQSVELCGPKQSPWPWWQRLSPTAESLGDITQRNRSDISHYVRWFM